MPLDLTGAGNQPDTMEEQPVKLSGLYYDSDYGVGEFSSFMWSDKPFADLDQDERNILRELVITFSRTDVASRRFEVEQAWEANLFERGYQHLLPRRGGGWQLPGENSRWGISATSDGSSLYPTNTYGRDHDIIVAALSREVPNVEFYPVDPRLPEDATAADQAEDFKDIFSKNNDLRARLTEAAHYFFTDDRVVFYTGYELNGEQYGFAESPEPSFPEAEEVEETEETPSDEAQDTDEVLNMPADTEETAEETKRAKRQPNGRETTKVYGKLSSKVPIAVNNISQMQAAQLYDDVDVSVLKARYPWIADRIKPGTCGIGEIELDYIARLNTLLALTGSYVTGDSLNRLAVEQKTWFRPSAFFDDNISKEMRDRLLEKFPTGCLVVMVGKEFAFAREECMDDHLTIAHPSPGNGQNRRALGASLIGPQKRLNNWVDLIDDFFRSTIPKKWMDNDAFNVEGVRAQSNKPGDIAPFIRQPGVPVNELIFIEPTPQHQPALPEFIMKFFLDVPQSLSGAVPSLFGGEIGGQVGSEGYAMQRDQALERLSVPWNSLKTAFSEVFRQAVVCAGLCRDSNITEYVPGKGLVSLDANDLRGSVSCYPEYDSSLPESSNERMMRDIQMVEQAVANPYYAATLQIPSNILELSQDSKISRYAVPGAADVEKQMGCIQILLRGKPQPNPQILELEAKVQQIKEGIAQDIKSNKPIPPGGVEMAQKFEEMVGQQIQSLPPMVSSVPPRPDESENHALAAATNLEWMNSPEGRKYEYGGADDKLRFANVHLNWQEHSQIAAKIAAQKAPQPQPKEGINISVPLDKMPAEVSSQIMARAGITAPPDVFDAHAQKDTNSEISKKVVPDVVKENAIANREKHL